MRLVTFSRGTTGPRLGAVLGAWDAWEWIVDVNRAVPHLPADMLGFIDVCGPLEGPTWRRANDAVADVARRLEEGRLRFAWRPRDVKLHAPIAPRLLRDFTSFRGHIARTRAALGAPFPTDWDSFPPYYNGNHLTVLGPGDSVPILRYISYATGTRRTVTSRKIDYEAELGYVIGREGRDVDAGRAGKYLFGLTIFNDFSARDVQAQAMKIGLGPPPGKDWANTLGPCVVTRDEFGPLRDQRVTIRVNGRTRLRGTFHELVFESPHVAEGERAAWSFEELVDFISHGQGIRAGEVWGSGTIPGGCELERQDRARYLRPGDRVQIDVESIGSLANLIGRPR